jgi:hypothetical protein
MNLLRVPEYTNRGGVKADVLTVGVPFRQGAIVVLLGFRKVVPTQVDGFTAQIHKGGL